jgi:flagellar hook-basal body complex protein FliE
MPAIPSLAAVTSPLTAGITPATAATAPTGASAAGAAQGPSSFGAMLAQKIGEVSDLQTQADQAAQAVATGQSSDLAGASVATEKAAIAIELATGIRNKIVDAYQEVMRMQV